MLVDVANVLPGGLEEVTQYYDFEEELQGRSLGTVTALYNSDVTDKAQKEKNHLLANSFQLVDAAGSAAWPRRCYCPRWRTTSPSTGPSTSADTCKRTA